MHCTCHLLDLPHVDERDSRSFIGASFTTTAALPAPPMDAGDDTATDASMIEASSASDNSDMSQSSASDCEIWVSVNHGI